MMTEAEIRAAIDEGVNEDFAVAVDSPQFRRMPEDVQQLVRKTFSVGWSGGFVRGLKQGHELK